jgi:hypothetical protein
MQIKELIDKYGKYLKQTVEISSPDTIIAAL